MGQNEFTTNMGLQQTLVIKRLDLIIHSLSGPLYMVVSTSKFSKMRDQVNTTISSFSLRKTNIYMIPINLKIWAIRPAESIECISNLLTFTLVFVLSTVIHRTSNCNRASADVCTSITSPMNTYKAPMIAKDTHRKQNLDFGSDK
eukprot:685501_1